MLNNLIQRFAKIVKIMRGEVRLTETNIIEMLREVRLALLEADVALPAVRDFINNIKKKAIGTEVFSSLTPGQMLVGIVQRELANLMGADLGIYASKLNFKIQPPAVILIAGLQGSGKTTTVGKLAKYLQDQKKKVLTVSVDIYRPAAIQQLKTVSIQAHANFFISESLQDPINIGLKALDYAKKHYYDVLIIDTAGRLSVDEIMMQEISILHTTVQPIETLFVVDAMLGQDAINTAKIFNDVLPLTGIILTKLDGDSRGGVALSVRYITNKPIKFVGLSEKLDGLEVFDPVRMANRILGMDDVLTLVEKVRKDIDVNATKHLMQKIHSGNKFDLNDFKTQVGQMKNMGELPGFLFKKLPILKHKFTINNDLEDTKKQMCRIEGIVNAMTAQERIKPELIKASRKRRIASGAGVRVQEVNNMLTQFEHTKLIMKKFKTNGITKMLRGMKNMLNGVQ